MLRRAGAVVAATVLALAIGAAAATAAPIVPSSAPDVDYHAEGENTLGGQIGINTDRAPNQGQALTVCDPDPRPAPHLNPGACAFGTPVGAGRDLVGFSPHIPDADESPNNAFAPFATPDSRETLNGQAGFENDGTGRFQGLFFGDEDMHFRLIPRTLDAYLAPLGDANNRWRRFCGTGFVDQYNNQGPGGAPEHPPLAPFVAGQVQVRKFVVEVWDGDFREPTKSDPGRDYYRIDILRPGSLFDTSLCVNVDANGNPTEPPPVPIIPPNVTTTAPTATAGSAPPLVLAASVPRVAVASAGARGPGGCVTRPFNVTVTGANIARVEFRINGHLLRRVTRRDADGLFRARVPLSRLTRVSNRVTARVVFRSSTGARARILPLRIRRCPRPIAATAPAFTG